jgi:hypothetical protein
MTLSKLDLITQQYGRKLELPENLQLRLIHT